MKVLIAEDNAGIRTVIEGLLAAWGYEAIAAETGTEAWQKLQSADPPSLVILDWMMPGMDGVEICRRLREKNTPTPPYIIFLTCRDNIQDVVTGLQAGANDYVTKPFEAEELRARLHVGLRVVELQAALNRQVEELFRQGSDLRKVNRALLLLYAAGQALVKSGTEQELLKEICRLIVETGGYRLAWVGYVDGSAAGQVQPLVYAGNDDMLRFAWENKPVERNLFHLSSTGQPTITRNAVGDPYFTPRQVDVPANYAAVITLPLQYGAHTFGELHIYSTDSNAFDYEEVRMLGKLAGDLTYGIVTRRSVAERQRAEDELQSTRDRAQLYLDVAGVLFVALNETGQITLVNRKGCDILGYREDELIGQSWFINCIPLSTRDEARTAFTEALAGKLGNREYSVQQVVTKTGAERILEIHNALLYDHAGQVAGILFSGTDITDRQRAEMALRESEKNYRTLFDQFITSADAISAYKSRGPKI